MIEIVKKVLAILALLCMAVFVIAIPVLVITGTAETHSMWMIAPLSAFLVLGGLCLLIRYLQNRAEEQKKREEASKVK